MNHIRFSEDEATVLYYVDCPSTPCSTVHSTLRSLCYSERSAPPSFEIFKSALNKALQVGILRMAPSEPGGEVRFYIVQDTHAQIHFDKSNEHVSEGVAHLMSKSWPVQNDATFPISKREYQSLAHPLQA